MSRLQQELLVYMVLLISCPICRTCIDRSKVFDVFKSFYVLHISSIFKFDNALEDKFSHRQILLRRSNSCCCFLLIIISFQVLHESSP